MLETDTEHLLRLTVPDRRYRRVSLLHELRRPRTVPFALRDGRWELAWTPEGVDRVEYRLEVERRDGRVERRPPAVAELPGYAPPAWTTKPTQRGTTRRIALQSRLLRTEIEAELWSPADATEPLPLLVVHDGPEYAERAQLLDLLAQLGCARAALLPPPGDRNESYSASTRYARALTEEWLPRLGGGPAILVGASLGALAALHAHWLRPDAVAGLFLQSGSYFRRRFDGHESHFPRFSRIARFVATAVNGRSDPRHVPVTLTVGLAEENLDNNRLLADSLAARGWDVRLVEHRDAHNWTSWRDVLHPHLADLIARTGGARCRST